MTKWEKKQLMADLTRLRSLIKKCDDLAHVWLNYPSKPCTTPIT